MAALQIFSKHRGIKQPFNVFMYFVDGEFLEVQEGWVMSEASAGGLEVWGLEWVCRLLHTFGRCCPLARNELRCHGTP